MANRFQLWGQAGWASAEVVGETHYAKAIRALFGSDFNPAGTEITVPLQLIPDRSNRHDRNAVGVWSGASLLGHLPRSEAARYVEVLSSLTARGLVPEVNARIQGREWAGYDGRAATFDGSIRLDLAEPHLLVPGNPPPAQEHRVLPAGSAVQVDGQQQFLEALRPLLRPEGECWAYVTLHEMADHLIEVRIGDARVGDLSPKMSGELLPALRHLAERGLVTAARAIVKGHDGKAEVMLHVARVQDLPEAWQGPAGRRSALAPVSPAAPAAGPAVFPSGPASAQAAPATTGRAPAGSPASGVASTGPVTTAPATATPGPAGSPSTPAGGPAGEPLPSWAAPPLAPPAATEPVPSWASPAEPVPAWAAPAESLPTWAPAGDTMPSWAVPSGGVPSWATSSSSGLPTLPSTGALPGGANPRLDPVGPSLDDPPAPAVDEVPAPAVSEVPGPAFNELPGSSFTDPHGPGFTDPAGSLLATRGAAARAPLAPEPVRPVSPAPAPMRPVSPAPESRPVPAGRSGTGEQSGPAARSVPTGRPVSLLDDPGAAVHAETTVIPALTAVVKGNAARRSGVAPVSPAPESNPHPPIPSAPTGITFVVPPGWPVPPEGWFPPEGWRPDPSWPLAPAGWQWWVPTWD